MNDQSESAGDEYAPALTIWSLAIGLMVITMVLITALIWLLGCGSSGNMPTAVFLLIVAVGGAIGGLIHDLNSFVVYVGVGKLKHRWVPQYLVRPFLGMTLAIAVTLIAKGDINGKSFNVLPTHEAHNENSNAKQGSEQTKGGSAAGQNAGKSGAEDSKGSPVANGSGVKPASDSNGGTTTESAIERKENERASGADTSVGNVLITLSDAYYYGAIAVLVGMFVDLALQKLQDVMFAVFGRPAPKADPFELRNNDQKTTIVASADPQRIIAACEAVWEANKSDGDKFVKAVADKLGDKEIREGSNADAILHQLQTSANWANLGADSGHQAKAAADRGKFVVGGLSSGELSIANGQVLVVVAGPLDPAQNRYPTAYWGTLNAVGARKRTIDAAFSEPHRNQVRYFVHQSTPTP